MQWRQAIIIELQERVLLIRADIEIKQAKKQAKIVELDNIIQEHQEDLEIHLILLHELGVSDEDDEEDDKVFETTEEAT